MCGPESCGRSRGRGCASEAERRRPQAQRPRRRLPPPGPQPAPPARGHGGAGAEGGTGGGPRGEAGAAREPRTSRRLSPGAGAGSARCVLPQPLSQKHPERGGRQLPRFSFPGPSLPPTPALSHLTKQRSRKVTKRSHSCRPVPRPDPSTVWGYCGKKRGFQP